MMSSLPVYISIGGQSSRFGEDKASYLYHGRPLVTHVAAQYESFASAMVLIDSKKKKQSSASAPSWLQGLCSTQDCRIIFDYYKKRGPLAGLHAASFDAYQQGWQYFLFAGCDQLGFSNDLLQPLFEHVSQDLYHVIAYRGDVWQPMPAIYHVSILSTVESALQANELALWRIIQRSRALALPLPPGWQSVININRSSDLL